MQKYGESKTRCARFLLALGIGLLVAIPVSAQDEGVVNGGFETPVVSGFEVIPSGELPGWDVIWVIDGTPGGLELQRGILGGADSGEQHAELGTDTRPDAAVAISQAVPTCAGAGYQLTFAWKPRPGTAEEDNVLGVDYGGWTMTYGPAANLDWQQINAGQFVATETSTLLRFTDLGVNNDTFGPFVDTVSVSGPSVCVDIDVKPGSFPNCFNPNEHGVVPIAVLGSAAFDVASIDPATLQFGSLSVKTTNNGRQQCSFEDVSGDFTFPEGAPDGFLDLVCQFDDDGSWDADEGDVSLTGLLLDGRTLFGTDSVCIVPPANE